MEAIIGIVISLTGYLCYGIDFCTLFTFVSVAITLYRSWLEPMIKLPDGR